MSILLNHQNSRVTSLVCLLKLFYPHSVPYAILQKNDRKTQQESV